MTRKQLTKRPLSYSSLRQFKKSPRHYLEYIQTPRKEPSKAMILGSAIDCLVLTPDEFLDRFILKPDALNRRSAASKIEFDAFMNEHAQKQLVTAEQMTIAQDAADSVLSSVEAIDFLRRAQHVQQRVEWTRSNLPFIGYIDAVDDIIVELKTGVDGSPHVFQRDAYNYAYYMQAGMYVEGEQSTSGIYKSHVTIFVETVAPYAVACYEATDDYINAGRELYHKLSDEFAWCMKNDFFQQGYEFWSANGSHVLDLPQWAKNRD